MLVLYACPVAAHANSAGPGWAREYNQLYAYSNNFSIIKRLRGKGLATIRSEMGVLDFYRSAASAYKRLKSLNAFILERYRECEAEVLMSQERRENGMLAK